MSQVVVLPPESALSAHELCVVIRQSFGTDAAACCYLHGHCRVLWALAASCHTCIARSTPCPSARKPRSHHQLYASQRNVSVVNSTSAGHSKC